MTRTWMGVAFVRQDLSRQISAAKAALLVLRAEVRRVGRAAGPAGAAKVVVAQFGTVLTCLEVAAGLADVATMAKTGITVDGAKLACGGEWRRM